MIICHALLRRIIQFKSVVRTIQQGIEASKRHTGLSTRMARGTVRDAMIRPSLRAIVFDFNGVIADDETPHLLAFQQALAEDRLHLTQEDYYERYLGMDERNCLNAMLTAVTGHPDPVREQRIHERKAVLFREYMRTTTHPCFPAS